MILNNYNNSIPENTETELTFTSNSSPRVFVRNFNHVLASSSEHLIVPYYVCGMKDTLYCNSEIGDTFTTIITFDEDIVDKGNVQVIKSTTYSGEFVFDVDLLEYGIDSPGLHSFSIRCIDSLGVGSATMYYKFLVRDPVEDAKVVDLDTTSSFSVSQDADTPESSRYSRVVAVLPNGSTARTGFVETDYADYSVVVTRSGDTVDNIAVTVDGVLKYTHQDSDKVHSDEDISGTYTLVTTASVEGSTVLLTDYLETPAAELPSSVVIAAARNKVALTMLMRAAKVYGANKLVLPKDMQIVFDYHNKNGGTEQGSIYDSLSGRDDVMFPNSFVLDLNGSTISTLLSARISGAILLNMFNNFDTHVINGSVFGNYRKALSSTIITDGGNVASESTHAVSMDGCAFCSFDNVEVAYTHGYEATLSIYTPIGFTLKNETKLSPKFDSYGFIDYDGVVHNMEAPADSNAVCMMYTGSTSANYRADFTPDMYGMRSISSVRGLFTNSIKVDKYTAIRSDNGSMHRGLSLEVFVHYYDENAQFLKTVKVYTFMENICPKGAAYCRISAKGTATAGTIDSLNTAKGVGMLFAEQTFVVPCGCSYNNCRFHDLRTCVCGLLGHQSFFGNSYIWNCGDTPGHIKGHVTTMAMDLEDRSSYNGTINLHNCEVCYGVRSAKAYYAFQFNITDNRQFRPRVELGALHMNVRGNNMFRLTKYSGTPYPKPYLHIVSNNLVSVTSKVSESDGASADGVMVIKNNNVQFLTDDSGPVVTKDCVVLNK